MGDLYAWLKVMHLLSLISWMAGIFYLPRLFVYHCDAPKGSQQSETFKVMERRLMRGIMRPAMYSTWIFGVWLGIEGGWFSGVSWLWVKLFFVTLLTIYHYTLDDWRKDFLADRNNRKPVFYRFMNEMPTLLLIVIVILVVVKPF
jgi:putative membrane protein